MAGGRATGESAKNRDHGGDGPVSTLKKPKSQDFFFATLMSNWPRVRTAVNLERQITVYEVESPVATFC